MKTILCVICAGLFISAAAYPAHAAAKEEQPLVKIALAEKNCRNQMHGSLIRQGCILHILIRCGAFTSQGIQREEANSES